MWKYLILLQLLSANAYINNYDPLSEQYINNINEKQYTWKAGKNFDKSEWSRLRKIASGTWRASTDFSRSFYQPGKAINTEVIPEHFDARLAWPNCKSIKQISDQSHCGSCWASSAAATMSDRICIKSNQNLQVFVSAEDLTACCWQCGNGCLGGEIPRAWVYWQKFGIVTGGLYNSSQGCKDYTLPPCEHHVNMLSRPHCENLTLDTPKCVRKCQDASLKYEHSLTFGQDVYQFLKEEEIQMEIMENGPVEGAIDIFDDFFSYKNGVYIRTSDHLIGGHAVKILGWGVENGVPYWLCANTWNTDWGDGGYFKILRGSNHCGVESQIFASLPKF
ncbi:cathepsin B-like [Sitophilus oryzae]|uniref:Cathepsin B-like n=1 Tax=Sitophilus oryzae TaxID=7048 RepID=A0A6J2XV40_SITOR|nr:cathepsin B-like [Sitophilus oryzae]